MSFTQTLTILVAKYLIFGVVLLAVAWLFIAVPRPLRKRVTLFAIMSMPLTFVASLIAAHLYYDPRPFMVSHRTPLIAHAAGSGFPSDHTLLGAAVASWVFRYDRRFGLLLLVLALAVGLARVHAGVHHPIDVIGAIIIACVVALLVYLSQKDIGLKDINWESKK